MKFYCKPTLTLFLLLYVAIQSAQAQDTLRITLQDAVRIALSDKPTIKVAGQEILLKKEARREAYARGKKVMINVLQYNPTSNSRIKAPQKREIVAFKHQLEQAGLEVTMRAVSYTHLTDFFDHHFDEIYFLVIEERGDCFEKEQCLK